MASAADSTTAAPLTPNTKASLTPNVANVVLGDRHIKPWYPSFYPEDLVGRRADWLYVCPWCFKYTGEILKFAAHCKACPAQYHPPGEVIYATDDVEIREVDGEEHKLYTQNLSLFAKLFLETKSVFFDTSTFLYYTLHLRTVADRPPATAAFFSKEKLSWDNNNLACILVFPPYQRLGLGQTLIGLSYALGRSEGRFGGPEKPLSAPGRKGYITYWSGEVAKWLSQQPKQKTVGIKAISEQTWIQVDDIVSALNAMDVCEGRITKGGSVVVNKARAKAWLDRFAAGKERNGYEPAALLRPEGRES